MPMPVPSKGGRKEGREAGRKEVHLTVPMEECVLESRCPNSICISTFNFYCWSENNNNKKIF